MSVAPCIASPAPLRGTAKAEAKFTWIMLSRDEHGVSKTLPLGGA